MLHHPTRRFTAGVRALPERRGRKDYEPPRYMTVSQAAEQLLEVIENREEKGEHAMILRLTLPGPLSCPACCAGRQLRHWLLRLTRHCGPPAAYTADTMCVGVARIGREDQAIIAAPLKDLVRQLAVRLPLAGVFQILLATHSGLLVACAYFLQVDIDFGPPLHSLVIVGETHPIEDEALKMYGHKPTDGA